MATPFDRVKEAWNSPDREAELNCAVEAMAAEGATREDLTDALIHLLDEVRQSGAGEDAQEIINGVGDRLHGWGNPKYHIATQTRPVSPPISQPPATDR
jgi:hypothetical protein